MTRNFLAVFAALWLSLTAVMLARNSHGADGNTAPVNQGVTVADLSDKQTAVWRAASSTANAGSFTTSVINGLTLFWINQRQTVDLTPHFSVASQSVRIRVLGLYCTGTDLASPTTRYLTKELLPPVTVSGYTGADAITDELGKVMGPTTIVPALGASHCYVQIITAPSSGTVSFGAGSE